MKISVISPVYQAQDIVDELVERLIIELEKNTNDYEILLVDDGSKDDSWTKIKENCEANSKVKGIKLSKNFGQHYAIFAGTKNAIGDFIIIIDCDLQDNPIYIRNFIKEFNKGYEIIFSRRLSNKQSFFKRLSSIIFNLIINAFSKEKNDLKIGSFVGFNKKVLVHFNKFEDKNRQSLQILKWLGFNSTVIKIKHNDRFSGQSTYTLSKLVNLALQGLINHTDNLLKFIIYLGFFISTISILSGTLIIIRYLSGYMDIAWTNIIVSIVVAILFSTGLILASIGIVGVYIGKIFSQSKKRPLFIIDKKLNI